MEGSDIKFPFLSRLLKPIITIIRKAAIVFTLTHTLCAFEGLFFLKIYLECSMWINTLKIVKHILVIQTVAWFPHLIMFKIDAVPICFSSTLYVRLRIYREDVRGGAGGACATPKSAHVWIFIQLSSMRALELVGFGIDIHGGTYVCTTILKILPSSLIMISQKIIYNANHTCPQ